ncbi:hypothetical protein WBJ53_32995 (plasmid) [Spirosoma sp. SC4-14]|uniref:hypothetical protein n=1 Tax=Spirosoma sp. SC4-14 TaxID=3128900 RepID=UPI0030D2AC29
MDAILLFTGLIGLCISGWALKGYLQNTPALLSPTKKSVCEDEPSRGEPKEGKPTQYVTTEDYQLVLNRLSELERESYSPGMEEDANSQKATASGKQLIQTNVCLDTEAGISEEAIDREATNSDKWKEIFALQETYRIEREKEKEIDFEREQALFDVSQSYDDLLPEEFMEKEIDQRLIDNQLEEGEKLETYQDRMNQFATLTKEMLILRLEAANTQLKEQHERHQATLLSIIASLIDRLPGDVNLKSVAQASMVAASAEMSNDETETNRKIFQEMFYKNFGS